MAQTAIDARKLLEKELLDLYQDLNKTVSEALRSNPHDLAKAAKISFFAWGRLALGEKDGRLTYMPPSGAPIIYLRGKPVEAYIDTSNKKLIIVIDIAGLGTWGSVTIDLRNRTVTEIILKDDGFIALEADEPTPSIYFSAARYISAASVEALAGLADILRRERETIKQIVGDVLKAPIDLRRIEEAIAREIENQTGSTLPYPDEIKKALEALYALALLPSIKK